MESVVHINKSPYDIKIDRTTIWGNPYSHKEDTLALYKVKTRKESIEKYREYILNNPELLAKLPELKGKVLGCWCKEDNKNVPCHGDVLIELLNQRVNLDNL
jgi:hypothetical protein